MTFLLPGLLLSLLLSVTNVQALSLAQEDKVEVINHWEPYLKSQDQDGKLDKYIVALLDITDLDAEIAGTIASLLFEKDIWKSFVQKRDLDATLALIEMSIILLRATIWDECAIKFPPQLADIQEDMDKSGLTEEEYLTKVRRAFLAFTIVVSCMDQVINLEQLA